MGIKYSRTRTAFTRVNSIKTLANTNGWQLNWMLLPKTTSMVETKYYSFAGQRVAMRKDGVLTYLHSDHLGSTVLETNPSAAIAELLFNQSVTWGDVLNHDGGSAALMVFYNNGTYQGGFWGITGDAAGTPVSSNVLSQSKKDMAYKNIGSSNSLHNGTLAIPRRTAPKGEYYQYYFLKQTDYGVKNYAVLGTDIIMGVWTIADLACKSSGRWTDRYL